MKYYELKEKQAEELNNFPIHFAFSNEQFQEVLRKLDVKEEETLNLNYDLGQASF